MESGAARPRTSGERSNAGGPATESAAPPDLPVVDTYPLNIPDRRISSLRSASVSASPRVSPLLGLLVPKARYVLSAGPAAAAASARPDRMPSRVQMSRADWDRIRTFSWSSQRPQQLGRRAEPPEVGGPKRWIYRPPALARDG
jgi:hypothetical protein